MRWLRAARNLLIAMTGMTSGLGGASTPAGDMQGQDRRRMIDEIVTMARSAAAETRRGALDARTLQAMERVPRERFVAPGDERAAYENRPLAIGSGQTISQPYIVALMTDLLELRPDDRVLEIGTGSGYQAAVLAELAREVYSVEIVEPLARSAAARLSKLGYRNVATRVGDGYEGWAQHAPYDAIIVTAAAADVPRALLDQLKAGGRMVIPIGASSFGQVLYLIRKQADGSIVREAVLRVRFVPFTGQGATSPGR